MQNADENYVVCGLKVTPKKPDFNLILILFLPYEAIPLSRFQSKRGFFAVTKTNKINT